MLTPEGDEQQLQAAPGDVLNPDTKGNSPHVKVAVKGRLSSRLVHKRSIP